MANQWTIILTLWLLSSVYLANSCLIDIPKSWFELLLDCKAKYGINDDEAQNLSKQSAGDIRFRQYGRCFYEGVEYLKDGELKIDALEKFVQKQLAEKGLEETELLRELMDGIIGRMEKANQYSDVGEKSYQFMALNELAQDPKYDEVMCMEE